ncbi:MAG TPA: S-methyl-5-thioribose-1-phosphate isomerase [Chloroflexia bacterium]|nr:S-methyl-5-thioribose-1-phosphate isomerase [Chloroflexia bacterium]
MHNNSVNSLSLLPGGEVPQPVEWLPDGTLMLVDQTALPARLERLYCRSIGDLAGAIRTLKVRGAPAIGVAAAYGLCLASNLSTAPDAASLLNDLESAAATLRSTRPTAVNLAWALDKVLVAARSAAATGDIRLVREAVLAEAQRIDHENQEGNRRMGEHGAQLLSDGMNVLTHCNTGPLAAGGIGSALGLLYTAHRQGKRLHAWVDETRPLLQGARLTTWELTCWSIPCTLIADNMAASIMAAGRVDAVLVGADRIAANGDVANKIGTYGLAVLANAHNIPFYVAAPNSTIDLNVPTGREIKIEERHEDEVTHHGGTRLAPEGVRVYNPAFDVTPSGLVGSIITESGVLRPPFSASLAESFADVARRLKSRAIQTKSAYMDYAG